METPWKKEDLLVKPKSKSGNGLTTISFLVKIVVLKEARTGDVSLAGPENPRGQKN